MHLLFVVSIIYTIYALIKESCEKPIPAENWANKDLYYEDILNGVPIEQRMKNVRNGKYKLTEKYPEPHRWPDGKIAIENDWQYEMDCRTHGVVQAQKWVKQGKYNLTPEQLKRQDEEYEKVKKMVGLYLGGIIGILILVSSNM